MVGGVEGIDQVTKQDERSGCVEKGIVPGFFRDKGADLPAQAELIADVSERVIGQIGPCGAGEQKRIDPWAEAVTRKGPQKAFFRAFSMGDDHRAAEAFIQLGPERKEGRSLGKMLGADAMNLASRPLDGLIGMKMGDKSIAIAAIKRPRYQPNLHRSIRHPRFGTRRLEVDGGEAAFVNEFQVASVQFSKKTPDEDAWVRSAGVLARRLLLNL